MSTPRNTCLALLLGASAMAAPMTDRITSDELNTRRQSNASPLTELEQKPVADITIKRPVKQSVISHSAILSDGANWTLVPRGAVLHTPKNHRSKIDDRPVGNLVSWSEFLNLNSSWLVCEPVSLGQAEGVEVIKDERRNYWPKQDKIVIAVHLGGPISVPAPLTPEEIAEQS